MVEKIFVGRVSNFVGNTVYTVVWKKGGNYIKYILKIAGVGGDEEEDEALTRKEIMNTVS